MAVSFVRVVGSGSSGSNRTSFTLSSLPANIPVGDTLVIVFDSNSASSTACTASDNSTQAGTANSYTVRLDSTNAGTNTRLVAIVCQVTRQIQTTDTITVNHPNSEDAFRILQFTGSSGFDAASTTNTGTGTGVTSNNVTAVGASGMLIACVAFRQTATGTATVGTVGGGTATVGATTLEGQIWNSATTNSTGAAVAAEYANFTSQGTADGTFTLPASVPFAAGIISLATGGTTVTRDVTSAAAVSTTDTRDVTTAAAIDTPPHDDVTTAAAVSAVATRNVTSQGAISRTITADVTTTAALDTAFSLATHYLVIDPT